MKTIEEIMGLVNASINASLRYGTPCGIEETKSKLREFVREPLSDDVVETLIERHAPPIHPDFKDDDGFEEFVRSIERAHGIGA